MKVEIDGIKYIKKPEEKIADSIIEKGVFANNDPEAAKLYYKFEPMCPECGRRAFPTNFPAEIFGGKKSDKRTVWFCSDMGHCAFSISKDIKWKLKKQEE